MGAGPAGTGNGEAWAGLAGSRVGDGDDGTGDVAPVTGTAATTAASTAGVDGAAGVAGAAGEAGVTVAAAGEAAVAESAAAGALAEANGAAAAVAWFMESGLASGAPPGVTEATEVAAPEIARPARLSREGWASATVVAAASTAARAAWRVLARVPRTIPGPPWPSA